MISSYTSNYAICREPLSKKTDKDEPVEEQQTSPQKIDPIFLGTIVVVALLAIGTAIYELVTIVYQIAEERFSGLTIESAKELAEKKLPLEFIKKIQEIPELNCPRFFQRLALSTQTELSILVDLTTLFHLSTNSIKEIFFGAHVYLKDGGNIYEKWKTLSCNPRLSSHPSLGTQYGIEGNLIRQLLFSSICKDAEIYTWFQLERYPTTFGHVIRHMIDYIKYKFTSRNQGPQGSSASIHTSPLFLERQGNL